MNSPERIEFKIDIPGLPELAPLVEDFASRVLGLAEFTGKRRDDKRRAEDLLRLQFNLEPVDFAGLVVKGDLGRALADTVVGSQDS